MQNSQLNEMLGQVKYVFADKTGTITKNKLSFRLCSIGGIIFEPKRDSENMKQVFRDCTCFNHDNVSPSCDFPSCHDIHDMFLAMCLCHTVIPHTDSEQNRFFVGSPDEKAVIQGANLFDIVTFENR